MYASTTLVGAGSRKAGFGAKAIGFEECDWCAVWMPRFPISFRCVDEASRHGLSFDHLGYDTCLMLEGPKVCRAGAEYLLVGERGRNNCLDFQNSAMVSRSMSIGANLDE